MPWASFFHYLTTILPYSWKKWQSPCLRNAREEAHSYNAVWTVLRRAVQKNILIITSLAFKRSSGQIYTCLDYLKYVN